MISVLKPCLDAIDFIHDNYHPMYEDLGGVSIGFCGDGLPKWQSFDDLPELKALPKKIVPDETLE